MILYSWSDPRYFDFLTALVKSARYHGNTNRFVLHLMDFDKGQRESAEARFSKDDNIEFWYSSHEDFGLTIRDRVEYYRNSRPRYFLKLMEQFPEHSICTLAANGLILTDISYIERILREKDFVFMERTKRNVHQDIEGRKFVHCIEDVHSLVEKNNLNLDDVMATTTGKVVLLGTHAFKNSEEVKKVIKRWKDSVENEANLAKNASDMDLFVKSYINISRETGYTFSKETGHGTPREKNPFCDTLFTTEKIWFAKGSTKFDNSKYREKMNFYLNWDYEHRDE